jgi:hypothetical protein
MATRVRTHKVTRNGKTYYRSAHTRSTRKGGGPGPSFGTKLRPARAWFNAKRSLWMLRDRRKAAAALYGTAAVTEILAFTVARSAGALLIVLGAGLAAAGYGLKKA